jgi:hypothetical protein
MATERIDHPTLASPGVLDRKQQVSFPRLIFLVILFLQTYNMISFFHTRDDCFWYIQFPH